MTRSIGGGEGGGGRGKSRGWEKKLNEEECRCKKNIKKSTRSCKDRRIARGTLIFEPLQGSHRHAHAFPTAGYSGCDLKQYVASEQGYRQVDVKGDIIALSFAKC